MTKCRCVLIYTSLMFVKFNNLLRALLHSDTVPPGAQVPGIFKYAEALGVLTLAEQPDGSTKRVVRNSYASTIHALNIGIARRHDHERRPPNGLWPLCPPGSVPHELRGRLPPSASRDQPRPASAHRPARRGLAGLGCMQVRLAKLVPSGSIYRGMKGASLPAFFWEPSDVNQPVENGIFAGPEPAKAAFLPWCSWLEAALLPPEEPRSCLAPLLGR